MGKDAVHEVARVYGGMTCPNSTLRTVHDHLLLSTLLLLLLLYSLFTVRAHDDAEKVYRRVDSSSRRCKRGGIVASGDRGILR